MSVVLRVAGSWNALWEVGLGADLHMLGREGHGSQGIDTGVWCVLETVCSEYRERRWAYTGLDGYNRGRQQ